MTFHRLLHNLTALVLCCILLLPASLGQQAAGTNARAAKLNLTIDEIMRGENLAGYEPRAIRWSQDSQKVFFEWKRAEEDRTEDYSTYVVNRDGSGLKKLTKEEAKAIAPPVQGELSKDKKRSVYADEGDLFLYDHTTGKSIALTKTAERESSPSLTKDGNHVVFRKGNNLFLMSIEQPAVKQLTQIVSGKEAEAALEPWDGPKKGTESQEFLKQEERKLLEYVDREAKLREKRFKERKEEDPQKPFKLPENNTVEGLWLSPDESYAIVALAEPSRKAKNTVVPDYIEGDAYTKDIPGRANVGDEQDKTRMTILRLADGKQTWVEHGITEPVPEPKKKEGSEEKSEENKAAEASKDSSEKTDAEKKPKTQKRELRFSPPEWSEDGTKVIVGARSADNKDRWIFALDTETGKTRELFHEHDDAWVGRMGSRATGWLKDNETVYFLSEADGWSHVYTVAFSGGGPKQLTRGKWEVQDIALSDDGKTFYLTTNEVHHGEKQLYSMAVTGGERTRITKETGSNEVVLSPDETMGADLYSFENKPPELYLMEAKPGAALKQITTSPAPEFSTYPWTAPPVIHIAARDGAQLPARLYKPANWQSGGPAVVFVHGAGYLQNAHKWWSSYYREYMFHHLLMDRGYMVLDIDYRASAGYGRDWRTAIYRFMGGKDLDDQVDGAKWLVSEQGVDAKRIGIYGGSYGGFITLMALFTQPDVFAAGAALRPVTDWAHYNHGYTSNILNIPQDDREAYVKSSPIYHAEGLKGALLICHGMVDTNVHYQDSVRLAQKLIELRKENWELASYPVESHGFTEPTSWADEYKRILKLFETNLKGSR